MALVANRFRPSTAGLQQGLSVFRDARKIKGIGRAPLERRPVQNPCGRADGSISVPVLQAPQALGVHGGLRRLKYKVERR